MDTRLIALFCLFATLSAPVVAQTGAPLPARASSRDIFLGLATYRLWDGEAPGARGTEDADVPTLTEFRVQPGTGNGTAVVIAPGGAYLGLASNLEGRQVADWFAARGVVAFVLKYRLGARYLYPTPLVDARRAIRFVRAHAEEFGVSPDRIGMMGFSAGGHLAATAGTMFDAGDAGAPDLVDRVSSRPDFVVLGYPWLNAMQANKEGLAYCGALKIDPGRCAQFEQYSPERRVSQDTPPVFIYHTTDDTVVPVEASVSFYRALVGAGVPAEMHLFRTGKHGSGLGLGDAALDAWPALLEAWMRGRGLLAPDPAIAARVQRQVAPPAPRQAGAPFTPDLAVRDLVADVNAKAVLVRHLGEEYVQGIAEQGATLSLRGLALYDPDRLDSATLAAIERDLAHVPR